MVYQHDPVFANLHAKEDDLRNDAIAEAYEIDDNFIL